MANPQALEGPPIQPRQEALDFSGYMPPSQAPLMPVPVQVQSSMPAPVPAAAPPMPVAPAPMPVPAPVPQGPTTQPMPIYASRDVSTPGVQQSLNMNAAAQNELNQRAADASDAASQADIEREQQKNKIGLAAYEEAFGKDKVASDIGEGAENYLDSRTKEIDKAIDASIAQQRKIAMEDPTDFWGNSSTLGKIGAVFTAIGLGLGGKSNQEWIEHAIGIAAKDQENRFNMQEKIQKGLGDSRAAVLQYAGEKRMMLKERRAATAEVLAEKLKAAELQTPDLTAKARYADAAAKTADFAAKARMEVSKEYQKGMLENEKAAVDRAQTAVTKYVAELNYQGDMAKAAATAATQKSNFVQPPHFTGNIPKEYYGKENGPGMRIAVTDTSLGALNHMMDDIRAGDIPALLRDRANYEASLRQYTQSGARLEAEEATRFFDPLSVTLKDWAAGKVTDKADLINKLEHVQELFVENVHNVVRSGDKDAQLDYNDPLYGPIALRQRGRAVVEDLATNAKYGSEHERNQKLYRAAFTPQTKEEMAIAPAAKAYINRMLRAKGEPEVKGTTRTADFSSGD